MAQASLIFIAFVFLLLLFLVPILLIVVWREVRRRKVLGAADEGRLAAVEFRMAELERRLSELTANGPESKEAAPSDPGRAAPRPHQPTPASAPASPPPSGAAPSASSRPLFEGKEPTFDLEGVIAGRWLNRVGILAILLASFFFAKYAFDNDWIGPTGQLTILLLAAVGLLFWSARLLKTGYPYFSEGIAGLGAALLYLALWAGWSYYELFPQQVSFFGMTIATAAMSALAFGRESLRIALIAMAGGYATPLLVSTGVDQQTTLFTYLLVLNGGMLLLSRVREWKAIEWLAFLSTLVYFWGWYVQYYAPAKLPPTALWATAFFVQFAALPVLRSRLSGEIPARHAALVLGNACWYLGGLHAMLWPEHRWTLTLAVLALAGAHLAAARIVGADLERESVSKPADVEPGSNTPLARILFAGLALTFATLAVPIRLEGEWITIAWAIQGGVLAVTGFTFRLRLLRWAALFLFAVTAIRLIAMDLPVERLVLNARFATFLVAAGCLLIAFLAARANRSEIRSEEAGMFNAVGIAANVVLLWALSIEVWDAMGRRAATAAWEIELSQQLGLSLFWVVYAGTLTAAGFRKFGAGLRWQGIALFGLVVGKVFIYDLALLERFYRVASFMVLGTVLLGVSLYYQRRSAQRKTE